MLSLCSNGAVFSLNGLSGVVEHSALYFPGVRQKNRPKSKKYAIDAKVCRCARKVCREESVWDAKTGKTP
jgi:hypothetical protein